MACQGDAGGGFGMSPAPADLVGRVPTLTEVLELLEVQEPPAVPGLGEGTVTELGFGGAGAETDRLADRMMDALAPQMDALISSRLRDVLAPALQDAVEEVIDRFRGPLVEAVAAHLRELVQGELRQSLHPLRAAEPSPGPPSALLKEPPDKQFP